MPLISQDEKHDHSVVLQALSRLENGNEAAITSLRYSVLLLLHRVEARANISPITFTFLHLASSPAVYTVTSKTGSLIRQNGFSPVTWYFSF